MHKLIQITSFTLLSAVFLGGAKLLFPSSQFRTSQAFYLYFFGLPLFITGIILLTRKHYLDWLASFLLFFLPFVGLTIPPRRYGFSGVSVIACFLLLMLVHRKIAGIENIRVFPHAFAWLGILSVLPAVCFSEFMEVSLLSLAQILCYYVIFIVFNHLARLQGWPQKMLTAIMIGVVVAALMILFERITGLDPSLTHHPRKAAQIGGVAIQRCSGVFQDPQKAAQFLASFGTLLLFLLIRKTDMDGKMRKLAFGAVVLSWPALLLTMTRASIYSAAAIGVLGLVLLNRLTLFKKISLWMFIVAVASGIMLTDVKTLKSVLPKSFAARMDKSLESADGRVEIWKKSMYVLNSSPIAGIGPGAYADFLIKNDSYMRELKESGFNQKVPTMPESGYLKIVYETGIVGATGTFLVLLIPIGIGILKFVGTKSRNTRSILIAGFAGLAVFLGTSVTVFSLSDSRNALCAILLMIIILHAEKFDFGSSSAHFSQGSAKAKLHCGVTEPPQVLEEAG